jgi:hypothetical protein
MPQKSAEKSGQSGIDNALAPQEATTEKKGMKNIKDR